MRDDSLRLARPGLPGLRRCICGAVAEFRRSMESICRTGNLPCAPVHSPEGQHYLGGMRAAANFAWGNRQLLMWQAREVLRADLRPDVGKISDMHLVYDVAHNIAKFEDHEVDGVAKRVWVHRKGATRAFPPNHPEVPEQYRQIGQPVLIPGDMGAGKLGAVGTAGKHGADLRQRLPRRGAAVEPHGADEARARSKDRARASQPRRDRTGPLLAGLAEEQPDAYKDVDLVVDVVHRAGLAKKVVRLPPDRRDQRSWRNPPLPTSVSGLAAAQPYAEGNATAGSAGRLDEGVRLFVNDDGAADNRIAAVQLSIRSYSSTAAVPSAFASTLPRSPTCRSLVSGAPWAYPSGFQ